MRRVDHLPEAALRAVTIHFETGRMQIVRPAEPIRRENRIEATRGMTACEVAVLSAGGTRAAAAAARW